jgi:hypothetical protein
MAIRPNGSTLNVEEVLHAMGIYLNARAPLRMAGNDVFSTATDSLGIACACADFRRRRASSR